MRRALYLVHFFIVMGDTLKQCLRMVRRASIIGGIANHQHGLRHVRQTFWPVGIGVIITPLRQPAS